MFHCTAERCTELGELPPTLPDKGFLWLGCARREYELQVTELQDRLQQWCGGALVEEHASDLLSNQLPSQHDYTSWYDLLVFRRLAVANGRDGLFVDDQQGTLASARRALAAIDTSAVGFAVFDRVLLSVHPTDCMVREHFAQRLGTLSGSGPESRSGPRAPASPADLMLRMANHMVDSYLSLRRLLTGQFTHLQQELLNPNSRFNDWSLLVESRNTLHMLEGVCEDQRSAMQEWLDALEEWPDETEAGRQREHELLRVRSRDVLEHIERVLGHMRRLSQSAETAVQMHFSALSQRTNDIMRTLTVLTAVFLPLNLITGFFGMNFDSLPLIHTNAGVWLAVAMMGIVGVVLIVYFWRKRYLSNSAGRE